MENLVLYRKYRPQNFSDVIGQDHITKTIENEIKSGHVAHAYLFSGPRGCGKTTTARIIARAVNCLNRKSGEAEPCGKCASCLDIANNRSMDLVEIDAASHRGIDDIRELREGIKFAPSKAKYKVFIIDECHQLSKDASNALLKTLEEPPAHAIFVLATTEIHKLIPTILSRCQKFDFRKLRLPELTARLQKLADNEKIKTDKAALELIALNSGGSVRDAESLLGQALSSLSSSGKQNLAVEDVRALLGVVETQSIGRFVDLLIGKKTADAISEVNKIADSGYDLQEYGKGIINYLRNGLILSLAGDSNSQNDSELVIGLTNEEFEKLKIQTAALGTQKLQKIIELFLSAQDKIKYSPIPQLPLELAIIESIACLKTIPIF